MITPQHNTPKILFFSRGQGRGHALPDLAISEALLREKPQLDLHFVSYGTGADTLRAHGQTITDLDLPDDNPFIETLVRCLRVIEKRKTSYGFNKSFLCISKTCGITSCCSSFVITKSER